MSEPPPSPTAVAPFESAVADDMAPVRAHARSVMRKHRDKMLANVAGTLEGADPEALHDMRVATRRLRAAFRLFREALAEGELANLNAETRWLGQLLGGVRDLDLFLAWLRDFTGRMAEPQRELLQRVLASREADRAALRAALLAGLASDRYANLVAALGAFLEDSPATAGCESSAHAVVVFADAAIRRLHKRIRKLGRKKKAGDLERLHRLRILCKRMRYACEFFRELSPERLAPVIRNLVALQDTLGALRDAHVHAESLRPDYRRHGREVPMRMALLRVSRALRANQRAEYRAFRQAWKSFESRGARKQLKHLFAVDEKLLRESDPQPGADPSEEPVT